MSDGLAPAPDPADLAWLEMSDLGNAMRLVKRAGDRLMYVKDIGWFGWDGRSWRLDDGERLAVRLAHETARGIAEESKFVRGLMEEQAGRGEEHVKMLEGRADKLAGWAVRSGDNNRTKAMLVQAQAYLNVALDDLDRDPLAINCANGIVRLRKRAAAELEGEIAPDDSWVAVLEPHAPEARMTKMTACAWVPGARRANWDKHLETCLPDQGVRFFFKSAVGYTATGSIREQIFVICQGRGGDGKSTSMNAIRRVMGDYATVTDIKTWLEGGQRSGADASPDLARLAGDLRLCSTAEPPKNARLNDAIIKAVTGGTPILARHLSRGLFEYRPAFKLWIEVNKRPSPSGDDDGIWRRLKLILWTHQFPRETRIKSFEEELVEHEAEGILAWIVEGALDWLNAGGLADPPEMEKALDDYRRSSNPFGEWWMDRVTPAPGHRELSSVLYADYKEWAEANGHEPMKQAAFGRALADRQVLLAGKNADGKVTRKGAMLKPAARPAASSWGDDGWEAAP